MKPHGCSPLCCWLRSRCCGDRRFRAGAGLQQAAGARGRKSATDTSGNRAEFRYQAWRTWASTGWTGGRQGSTHDAETTGEGPARAQRVAGQYQQRFRIRDRRRSEGSRRLQFPAEQNSGIAATAFEPPRFPCYIGADDDSADRILDLRGLRCPQPVLRAKKALRDVAVGGALVLECTDPLTVIDVPHFVNQTGHRLADQRKQDDLYIFRIVKQR